MRTNETHFSGCVKQRKPGLPTKLAITSGMAWIMFSLCLQLASCQKQLNCLRIQGYYGKTHRSLEDLAIDVMQL